MVLNKLRYLKQVFKILDMFERVSVLTLRAPKCVLLTLSAVVSELNISVVKRWLQTERPQWAHFKIAPYGKYLGLYIGPGAGVMQWVAPLEKFKARVDEPHGAKLPASKAAVVFASRAVPVLSYVGQVFLLENSPPWSLRLLAKCWLCHQLP